MVWCGGMRDVKVRQTGRERCMNRPRQVETCLRSSGLGDRARVSAGTRYPSVCPLSSRRCFDPRRPIPFMSGLRTPLTSWSTAGVTNEEGQPKIGGPIWTGGLARYRILHSTLSDSCVADVGVLSPRRKVARSNYDAQFSRDQR